MGINNLRIYKIIKAFFLIATAFLLAGIYWYFSEVPSNTRDWSNDQALLPYAVIEGDRVKIFNIRNFRYQSTSQYEVAYYDKEFSLNELNSLDYIVEPFGSIGAAHTFLSFGFRNGDKLAISVEIRKEKGESFSPVKGVLRQYELMYVMADERDVLNLRTNHRQHQVYLYPMKMEKEQIRDIFVSMLTKANQLKDEPEFYNTVTNNCMTNIADHINAVWPGKISWDIRLLLPEDSDILLYELGFLDSTVSMEELRSRHLINEKSQLHSNSSDFSHKIRE